MLIENPMSIVLNLENCQDVFEVHHLLKTVFDLPEWYGENWDALWDCLDGYFPKGSAVPVKIYGYRLLPKELREALQPMLDIFWELSEKGRQVSAVICS